MMAGMFDFGGTDPETDLRNRPVKHTNSSSKVFTRSFVCFRYPLFVVSTMVLFVFSDLGLGTVVNVVFFAGEDVTTIGPAFSFSVMTLSRDSIKGGGADRRELENSWGLLFFSKMATYHP